MTHPTRTHPDPRRLRETPTESIQARRARELQEEARDALGTPDDLAVSTAEEQVSLREGWLSRQSELTDDGKTFEQEARDSAKALAIMLAFAMISFAGFVALAVWAFA